MKNFIDIKIMDGSFPRAGILHIPDRAFTLPHSQKYPLIIYYSGRIKPNPSDLIRESLPKIVEETGTVFGHVPNRPEHPIGFAVVALCDSWHSFDPRFTPLILNHIEKNIPGRIDPEYVFAAGISAGGQMVCDAITHPDWAKYYAGAVAVSVAGLNRDPQAWKNVQANQIETLFIAGVNEPTYLAPTRDARDLAEKAYPGSTQFVTMAGGHDDNQWSRIFNPTNPVVIMKGGDLSIYDWMLREPMPEIPTPAPPVQTERRVESIIINYSDQTTEIVTPDLESQIAGFIKR